MTRWYLAAAAASMLATGLFATAPAHAQSTAGTDATPAPMMGQGMAGQGMAGQGMMGQGTMGQGMMGRGMMQQPMMGGRGQMIGDDECPFAMMGDDDAMARRHMMHRHMKGQHMMGGGHGMMRGGMPTGMPGGMAGPMRVRPMVDTADVTQFFKRYLERLDNDRLKLGKVAEADADAITAEIVTVDDSLVQTYHVDRVTGRMSAGK